MRALSWCVWLVLVAGGCGTGAVPPDPRAGKMVYWDRETQAPIVDNVSTQSPVIHPVTGRPTLVPAGYCAKCQKWYPMPPVEIRQRNPKAALCPKSGDTLTLDGPWPETP